METVCKFKAMDGTMFDNKNECEAYEATHCGKQVDGLKIWKINYDGDFELVLPNEQGLLEAQLMSITTDNAFDFLSRIANKYKVIIPPACGRWYFNSAVNDWLEEYDCEIAMKCFKFMKGQ